MTGAARGPGVHVPPPIFFLVGWLVAWWLDRRLSFTIDGDGPGELQTILGTLAIAGGLGLMGWGMVTFARARTPVYPTRPARQLVTSGPYRFSRNPMYVGLTIAYLGASVAANAVWPLVTLPFVLTAVTLLVIRREERHLRAAFGAAYEAYGARVRRWI